VTGGDVAENAARLRAVLDGAGSESERDIIALNAGALLMTAGLAGTLKDGVGMAADTLASGAGGRVLGRFIEASND
jgi:anthranilate phosphoribosyltransferase